MTADRYAWMDAALCAQADPDAWHPDGKGAKYGPAKTICGHCPAMNGMWAGHSKKQREDQRREMGEAA
jgi:hypothetical protein